MVGDGAEAARAWAAAAWAEGGLVLKSAATGWGVRDELVAVAVVGLDGGVRLETRVFPERAIAPGATARHGLAARDVLPAPWFESVHGDLCRVLDGHTVLVYAQAYEARLLRQTCERYGLPMPAVAGWEDVMLRYRRYCGGGSARRLPGATGRPIEDARAVAALVGAMARGVAPGDVGQAVAAALALPLVVGAAPAGGAAAPAVGGGGAGGGGARGDDAAPAAGDRGMEVPAPGAAEDGGASAPVPEEAVQSADDRGPALPAAGGAGPAGDGAPVGLPEQAAPVSVLPGVDGWPGGGAEEQAPAPPGSVPLGRPPLAGANGGGTAMLARQRIVGALARPGAALIVVVALASGVVPTVPGQPASSVASPVASPAPTAAPRAMVPPSVQVVPSPTPAACGVVVVVADRVNLRAAPGRASAVVGQAQTGERFGRGCVPPVTRDGERWQQVRAAGRDAWVAARFLRSSPEGGA